MAIKIKTSTVDAAIDESDDGIAGRLADLLDAAGEWDWSDEAEHDPSDRLAVLESSGAWWLVYRGAEEDRADRYATCDEAWSALREQAEQIAA